MSKKKTTTKKKKPTAKRKKPLPQEVPTGMLDQPGIQDCLAAFEDIPDEHREGLEELLDKLAQITKVALYLGFEAGVKLTVDEITKGLLDDAEPEGSA